MPLGRERRCCLSSVIPVYFGAVYFAGAASKGIPALCRLETSAWSYLPPGLYLCGPWFGTRALVDTAGVP